MTHTPPPAKKEYFTPEQVCEALTAGMGMMTLAARKLNCSRETIRLYAKRYASVRRVIEDTRHQMGDEAEVALLKAIRTDQPWAIAFYLRTQCKDRGYVERKEITGKDGDAVQMKITEMVVRLPDEDGEDE